MSPTLVYLNTDRPGREGAAGHDGGQGQGDDQGQAGPGGEGAAAAGAAAEAPVEGAVLVGPAGPLGAAQGDTETVLELRSLRHRASLRVGVAGSRSKAPRRSRA